MHQVKQLRKEAEMKKQELLSELLKARLQGREALRLFVIEFHKNRGTK